MTTTSPTGTLTTSGLGSGLNISSMVSQLVAAEGDPQKALLTNKQSQLTAQFSALGTLKSALSSLQSSLESLNQTSDFKGLTATSGSQDLFTATADTSAVPGSYQVTVQQLAQPHMLVSNTFAGDQTIGGSAGDSLTLTVNGTALVVDLSQGETLGGLRDAINSATDNPGVTATLINADNGEQALVLSSTETGSANQIQVTENIASGTSLGLATANLDASGNPMTDLSGLDAKVTIAGITVTRPTNQITDAISGVTLSLGGADPGKPTSLTVGVDTAGIASAISTFVKSYNSLVGTISKVSGFQGPGVPQPALFGDSMTRTISNRLRSDLGSSLAGLSGPYKTLADIGVTANLDGTLNLDSDKLNQALSGNPGAAAALFASPLGYATQLKNVLSSYLGAGGVIQSRTDGIQSRLDDITAQQDALNQRLTELQNRYTAQFTAMDALVGQLTSTSNFLTQQLANLPGAYDPNTKSDS